MYPSLATPWPWLLLSDSVDSILKYIHSKVESRFGGAGLSFFLRKLVSQKPNLYLLHPVTLTPVLALTLNVFTTH